MNKQRFYYGIVFFVLLHILFIGYLVSTRSLDIGSDTYNYYSIYNGFLWGQGFSYEIGFVLLNKLMTYFNSHYALFFSAYFLVFCGIFFSCFYILVKDTDYYGKIVLLFFLTGAMFFSNWFFSAVNNGLRQGIALSFLYLSLSFLYNKRYLLSIFLYILALSFHNSILLFLPCFVFFRFFLFFQFKHLALAAFIFAILYYFGVNEFIVYYLSNISGLSLYNDIKFYSETSMYGDKWVGFDLSFVFYTLFWIFLPFALSRLKVFNIETKGFFGVYYIYCFLSIFYFFYGFGAFSNRYAFFAWLYLPILQSSIFLNLKIRFRDGFLVSVLFFYIGFFYMGGWYWF